MNRKLFTFLLMILLFAAACSPAEEENSLVVSLVADGRIRSFEYRIPVTVSEFLRDPKVDVQLGPLDRVNPEPFTQITDGMRVTVVRVTETQECEQTEIPFVRRTVPNEGLAPGTEQIGQAGQNGLEEICYRVRVEDGQRQSRTEISRVIATEPKDEVVYVGPSGEIDPVPIPGTLAYISNGNAWTMRGSSTTKKPLTVTADLDLRVFSLSSDGRRLLFSRKALGGAQGSAFNQLWVIPDIINGSEPVRLKPSDVLYADWVPNQENTISYSTGEARETSPGWQAFNDLWMMRIDIQTGDSLKIEQILDSSTGGLYGWWGTRFQWSPDGQKLAWIRADSIGLVDLKNRSLQPALLTYPVFSTSANWSWRATVSWSPDSSLLAATVHGAPVGSEAPENSPAFNVAITDANGTFKADVVEKAGIWSAPSYSPLHGNPDSQFQHGYLAYLKARDLANSINSQAEYDLIVADRDASNPRKIFPPDGQPGLNAQEFVWSPDGQQLAFIYRGNLWIIDVESQVAHQLTLDGGASKPVWTR